MKTISLALKFFRQHWLANVLVIAEIIFTFFTATILINRTDYIFQTYNAYAKTPIANSIYFMGRVGVESDKGPMITPYFNDLKSELSSLDGIKSISKIGMFNTDDGLVIIYDKETAKFIKQEVQGKWLDENESNEIVAYGTSHNIGDKVKLNLTLFNQYSYDGEIEYESTIQDFQINGIADALSDTLLYSTVKTNGIVNLDRFIFNNSSYQKYPVYFIPAENEIFDEYQQPTDTFFIYLNEKISQDDLNKIDNVLDKYGTHIYGKDILEKTYSETIDRFIFDFYTFLSIAIIAIVSLISIAFLNIKKFSNYIAVYYINGCSFKKAMLIYIIYLSILAFASIVLYYGLLFSINLKNMADFNILPTIYIRTYQLKFKVQLIAFTSVIAMMLMVSFVPFYFISRKEKINLLKNN